MALKALRRVNVPREGTSEVRVVQPGEELKGLSKEQEERLIELGRAERTSSGSGSK